MKKRKNTLPIEWHDMSSGELRRYRDTIMYGDSASALLRELLTGSSPCSIVSLGDSELKWWALEELRLLPEVDYTWLRATSAASGLHPEDDASLRPAFDAAVRNSPIILTQFHWPVVERLALEVLTQKGLWNTKPHVSCNVVYHMNGHGDFFPVLEGRRVLLVGGAQDWARTMASPAFQSAHGASYGVVGHVPTPARSQRPKAPHLPGMLDAVDSFNYDIALVAAGGLAFVICEHIRSRGRFAFDCGATDRMILGDRGARNPGSGGGGNFRVAERKVKRDGVWLEPNSPCEVFRPRGPQNPEHQPRPDTRHRLS